MTNSASGRAGGGRGLREGSPFTGRPFGIPVHVSPTWFIAAALITFLFAPAVSARLPGIGVGRYLVAFAFAVLLYMSVFVHELSHSVVARRFGLPVRRITLYLLGGVSEIERDPQTPLREFLVAFAGPLLSLVLAAAALGVYLILPAPTVASVLAAQLAIANLLVGVFNLLPGLPLDGGRMLRAGVWKLSGRPAAATLTAAWAGRALGAAMFVTPFVVAALLRESPDIFWVVWAALIGSFIWAGASQSLRAAKTRERIPQVAARGLARPATVVAADVPLAEALRGTSGGDAAGLVVADRAGEPIALVNETAVGATPVHRRPWVSAGAMARTLQSGQVLAADLSGQELLTAMQASPAPQYLLVEPGGEIHGVLVAADVERAFAKT